MSGKAVGRLFLYAFLLVCLCSCSSAPDTRNDPRGGGLWGGLRGIYAGDYQARVDVKSQELQEQKIITAELLNEYDANEREYRQKLKTLKSERQKAELLAKYAKTLSVDVNSLKSSNKAQEARLLKLKKDIEQLQGEIEGVNLDASGSDPERYKMLEKKRDALAKEYQALLKVMNAYSASMNK